MCVIMVLNCAAKAITKPPCASVNISAITVLGTFLRSMLQSVSLRVCATVQVNYSIASHHSPCTHPPARFSNGPFHKRRAVCAALAFCLENKSSLLGCAFQCELTLLLCTHNQRSCLNELRIMRRGMLLMLGKVACAWADCLAVLCKKYSLLIREPLITRMSRI